ncbi:MAG TPA: protein kinase [Bryobacteraceae bacterium]|nr:protein kinase [Bryobacteraceae bacterium]
MNSRVEQLFHEVADLPAEVRAQYFAERDVDESTRREVEALLAFDAGASAFLMTDISAAASRALPQLEGKGWRCGPYRLMDVVGRGGMGAVYLAERADGEVTQRLAVKLLPAGASDLQRERFLQERQILASLAHPNIARMMDAGHLDNGQPFLAMEYIDGQPIDAFSAGLGVRQKIALFLKVCAAVSYLHRNLIVHRDLKPSNILVTGPGDGHPGEPKLLDFGIAKILDVAINSTITSMRMLTPDYASPEQVTGGTVSTATDIYSLGAVLYRLLTGRGVHEFQDRSPEAIAWALTTREVTRPSLWTPELKGDLEFILMKALRKDPQDRYATVEQLAEDLEAFLQARPVRARSGTVWYGARKFVRRNRAAVALAGLALAAAVAGVTGILIQAHTARAQRDFALRQLSRAEAVNDLNSFVLSDAAPTGRPFTVDDLLGRAVRLIERQGGEPTRRADLLVEVGRQYTVQDEYAKARQLLEQAYQLSGAAPDATTRAEAACTLAQVLSRVGEPSRADLLFQEGLKALPDEPLYVLDRISCLERGSEIARNRGVPALAVERAQAARDLLKRLPVPSDLAELNTLITLAGAYSNAGRYGEAGTAFGQAASRLEALGRGDTERAATVYNNWGVALTLEGRPLDAEKALRRSIFISQADGTEQSVSPMLLVNHARALDELARPDQAASFAERGYEKAQQAGDETAISQALLRLAAIHRDRGDLERAGRMLSEVEPQLRRTLPPGHVAFASLATERALNAQAAGDLRAALDFSNQAVAIIEALAKAHGQGADRLPLLLTRRSDIELRLGRTDDAATDAGQAVSLLQQSAGSGTLSTTFGRAYLALGRALQAQQKRDEARAAFRSAAQHLESALGADHPDARAARVLRDAGNMLK